MPRIVVLLMAFVLVLTACAQDDEASEPTPAPAPVNDTQEWPDDARETVIAFIDARIAGEGAERFLTESAQANYDAPELDLYHPGYRGYEIVSFEAVDANSFEAIVEITRDDGSPVREILPVGPGESLDGEMRPFVIRAAIPE